MKNISNSLFNKRLLISLAISAAAGLLIAVGIMHIKLDTGLYNLLPCDARMKQALELSQHSNISEKVLVYIDKTDEAKFEAALDFINEQIAQLPIELKNAIPDGDDITQMMDYFRRNSLLLYPYNRMSNPFEADAVSKGLAANMAYLENMPFYTPDDGFFADPMMCGLNALRYANSMTPTEYMPQLGGVVSADGKAYLKILSAGFGTESYDKIAYLARLDRSIAKYAKEHNIDACIYSAHLYFWDSMRHISREVSAIFILSIALTFLIFFIFYKNVAILLYVFMPIAASFGLTFASIALFRGTFGAIALAFGATTAGITIDYSIHYISKVNMYSSLSELRRKIGWPMFFGFLTTVCSFSFLFLSRIVSLQEIALFGILAVTFSFVFSFFAMQPLLAPGKVEIPFRTVTFPKPNVLGVVVWSGLLLACIVGVAFMQPESDVMMMDMRHKTLEQRIGVIQQHFAESTDSVFLVLRGDTTDDVLDANYEASRILSEHNILINTPAMFMPSQDMLSSRRDFIKTHFNEQTFRRCIADSDFEADTFDVYIENAKHIDDMTLTQADMPEFLQRHIGSQFFEYNDQVVLMLHIPSRQTLSQIDDILTEAGIDHIAVSPTADSAEGLVSFERNAMRYIFYSLIAVTIILMIYFRHPLYGLLAAAPMVVGLMAAFGVAFWTGRGFNIMHFAAGIVVLGIGVDYGIYIVDAYRRRHTSEELNATIQSMFISGLTTIAGFGVLIISSNRSIFSLGSASFAGIVTSFLTAYLFVGWVCEKIMNNE
ncbi:MAG: MMPL family transporter [Spirochaetales bacterium]|nr:MMPL family transporter [Spirochaetales bacterium]